MGPNRSNGNNLCSEWIQFEFSEAAQIQHALLPKDHVSRSCVGCFDGTHINLLRPKFDELMFFNRKGKHSLNPMVVVNHNYTILSVCPKYGGAVHD